MIGTANSRRAALALAAGVLFCSLALASLGRASDPPVPGGSVSNVISLSLGEPSTFRRTHGDLYTSAIRAEVTATVPVTLSLADGEATQGPRRGHLEANSSLLSPALHAAADRGPYHSLDTAFPSLLRRWKRPVSRAKAKIRLRQAAPNARVLHNHHKLVLVTLTGPSP